MLKFSISVATLAANQKKCCAFLHNEALNLYLCVNTVIEHKYVRDRGIPESHRAGEVVKRHVAAEESGFNFGFKVCAGNKNKSRKKDTFVSQLLKGKTSGAENQTQKSSFRMDGVV